MNQKFSLKVARMMPAVVGTRDLLSGLLVNLLDNSLQYNSAEQAIEISARISRHRTEAIVAVRDYGAAIDLAEFRRLSKSLGCTAQPISARPLSSGLGLFIAGEFARAMKGQLSVVRHRGGGLTFSASLPISHQLSLLET
jgi:K+-sensing histidine kinase KdpD